MTNYNRLLLELNNKQYFNANEYATFLSEAGLDADDDFSAENDLLALKKTALAVLRALSNDISMYMKVETEFATTSAAYAYLSERIKDLKAEIEDIKEEIRTDSSDSANPAISFLFYDA